MNRRAPSKRSQIAVSYFGREHLRALAVCVGRLRKVTSGYGYYFRVGATNARGKYSYSGIILAR